LDSDVAQQIWSEHKKYKGGIAMNYEKVLIAFCAVWQSVLPRWLRPGRRGESGHQVLDLCGKPELTGTYRHPSRYS
jgi:hypothetical protein